jgi:hypothetical protein
MLGFLTTHASRPSQTLCVNTLADVVGPLYRHVVILASGIYVDHLPWSLVVGALLVVSK